MENKRVRREAPGIRRLIGAILLALCFLFVMVYVLPWHFPYERLDCLYGLETETLSVGHSGGAFVLYCSPIAGSPRAQLFVDGSPYSEAEYTDKEQFTITLGDELFEQPGRIDLMLKLTFSGCISLRTNTVSVYVTELSQ